MLLLMSSLPFSSFRSEGAGGVTQLVRLGEEVATMGKPASKALSADSDYPWAAGSLVSLLLHDLARCPYVEEEGHNPTYTEQPNMCLYLRPSCLHRQVTRTRFLKRKSRKSNQTHPPVQLYQ